jgi:hypothetical protein
MLPSFPLCRIILAEKRFAVVSELLAGKSQMKTIARALKPYAASQGFPVRKEPDMVAHPGGMRPRSPQLCCGVSEHNNR